MNAEFKTKWIAALRSGKYKQTKEYLRNTEGFCCLGVACDLCDPTGWRFGEQFTEYDDELAEPPSWVEESMGILDDGLYVVPGLEVRGSKAISLYVINDSGEFSFDQIADIIQYFF